MMLERCLQRDVAVALDEEWNETIPLLRLHDGAETRLAQLPVEIDPGR